MKNELTITIIACTVIFSGMGYLAYDTMNQQISTPVKTASIPIQSTVDDILSNEKYSVNYFAQHPKTTKTILADGTTLTMTLVGMTIPENNKLPWGFVEGMVANPVPGHPVIVQFFKSLDDVPVHVAQIDLNDDNSYEYKFRVLAINEGITTHVFEGDYFVKIFKTVYTPGST